MTKLLIVGAGGHGKVVAEIASSSGRWEDIGFLDDNNYNEQHHGFSLIGKAIPDSKMVNEYEEVFIAVGNNQVRLDLLFAFQKTGFRPVNIIHPSAIISNSASIMPGTVIMANSIINAAVKIGYGVIINTAATIDHDSVINDGVHICPGVKLAGNVTIGRCSLVGIGTSIIEGITVGDETIIGAGSVVIRDVNSKEKVAGNPASPI